MGTVWSWQTLGVIGSDCISVIGISGCSGHADSCRGINWVRASIVVVLVSIVIWVGEVIVTSMGLDLSVGCWC